MYSGQPDDVDIIKKYSPRPTCLIYTHILTRAAQLAGRQWHHIRQSSHRDILRYSYHQRELLNLTFLDSIIVSAITANKMGVSILTLGASLEVYKALPRSRATITSLHIPIRNCGATQAIRQNGHGCGVRLFDYAIQPHSGDFDKKIWRTIYEDYKSGMGSHGTSGLE